MKPHKVLFLALLVSAAFVLSAHAGDRKGNNRAAYKSGGYSGAQVHSAGTRFAQRSGSTSMGGNFQSSPRMSMRSMPSQRVAQRIGYSSGGNATSFNQRQFTPRTFNRANAVARFQANGNFGTNRIGTANRFARLENNRNLGAIQGNGGNRLTNNNRGFNRTGAGTPVFAQRSATWHRDWDRHSDHWWNGHRCRWVNNSWFIFDFGFVPWYGWSYYDSYPYDYYPYGYGGYGYGTYGYNPGVYDQSAYYDQGGNNYNNQS